MRRTGLTSRTPAALALAVCTTAATASVAAADVVVPDNHIVQGSSCIGLDCVAGESFGFDTLRLRENSLRINFDDTSANEGFPANDWRLLANDTAAGGENYFAIEDATAGRQVLKVKAGAPANSLYVDPAGNVGLGTASPGADLTIASSPSTPAPRSPPCVCSRSQAASTPQIHPAHATCGPPPTTSGPHSGSARRTTTSRLPQR